MRYYAGIYIGVNYSTYCIMDSNCKVISIGRVTADALYSVAERVRDVLYNECIKVTMKDSLGGLSVIASAENFSAGDILGQIRATIPCTTYVDKATAHAILFDKLKHLKGIIDCNVLDVLAGSQGVPGEWSVSMAFYSMIADPHFGEC